MLNLEAADHLHLHDRGRCVRVIEPPRGAGEVPGGAELLGPHETVDVQGKDLYALRERRAVFHCVKCRFHADGDEVTAANHLEDNGGANPLARPAVAA